MSVLAWDQTPWWGKKANKGERQWFNRRKRPGWNFPPQSATQFVSFLTLALLFTLLSHQGACSQDISGSLYVIVGVYLLCLLTTYSC